MSTISKIEKLPRQPGKTTGVATAFAFLTADHQAGMRAGISEIAPGEVDFELPFNEGIFVIDGELEIDGDGKTHVIAPGEFLWMPEGRKIVYRAKVPTRFLYMIPSNG